jgi:outer membrane immunogenic protein
MRKLLLSCTVLALSASAALAADLPSRKAPILPPPPPPPPLWTGFYVGLNAGGTWSGSNRQTIAVGPVAADNTAANLWGPSRNPGVQSSYLAAFAAAASATGTNGANGGFIGGGQIGYNYQFYNSFVAGLEADIQGVANSSGGRTGFFAVAVPNTNAVFTGVTSARGNLQYLGTVRGRLGWLFMPNLLVYGTGGLAYGGVSLNTATTVTASGTPWANAQNAAFGGVNSSNARVGWTAGGGLEWMFFPNWSAKVEYLYYDLGAVTRNFAIASFDPVPPTGIAIFGGQARARVNGSIVRAGVNYHFNWGAAAPVVAKY